MDSKIWQKSVNGFWLLYSKITTLCFISCAPFIVNAATHWLFEDGLIKSQVDTWYNVYNPSDLMLFIQQSQAVDELRALEKQSEDLIKQHSSLLTEDSIHKNQEKLAFFSDPDCQIARKKLSQFDLYISSFLRLEAKGIKIEHYLDEKQPLPVKLNQPFCTSEFLFSMKSYDHLEGVAERKFLQNVTEDSLVNSIPQVKNLPEFGHKVHWALQKNETSWILLNFAAIYWRVAGNSNQAVECLRRALDSSPRNHKDLALVSLANILHQSKYSLDAATLMHAALEITNDYDIVYFTLGNIYGALGQYDLADICYKCVFELQPEFEAARLRMHAARCEHKLGLILDQHELLLKKSVEDIEELSIKQHMIEYQQKYLADRSYPLRKYNIYNALELPENERGQM